MAEMHSIDQYTSTTSTKTDLGCYSQKKTQPMFQILVTKHETLWTGNLNFVFKLPVVTKK